MLGEMDEQVILGNFVDELYYKQCNHEGSDINKSPLLMSKSTSNMYHEGYDRKSLLCRLTTGDFNPRTHEGYDRTILGLSPALLYFNPRTHKGYDVMCHGTQRGMRISIHVPTKGTTRIGLKVDT